MQRLRRTADLGRNLHHHRPARTVIPFLFQHHPHRTFSHLGCILVRCLAHRGSTFLGVGATGKPGAVQSGRCWQYARLSCFQSGVTRRTSSGPRRMMIGLPSCASLAFLARSPGHGKGAPRLKNTLCQMQPMMIAASVSAPHLT